MSEMAHIVNSHTVSFERILPAKLDTAWQYLTDSNYLKSWLMAGQVLDGSGLIEFQSDTLDPNGVRHHVVGVLAECTHPTEIAYSWFEPGEDTSAHVRFHLEPRGEHTLLILTHTLLSPKLMPMVGAGWHTHLDILIDIIQGKEARAFDPQFTDLLKKYTVALAAAGVVATACNSPAIAQSTNVAHKSLNAQRSQLLIKYDQTWKDADDLKREIFNLKKVNTDVNNTIDDLDRDLKDKLQSLKSLELDIKDLDKALVAVH